MVIWPGWVLKAVQMIEHAYVLAVTRAVGYSQE